MAQKIPQGSSIDYQNPPAGTHLARCYRVIDLGTQTTEWKGEKKQQYKIMISWELPNSLMDPTEEFPDPRPFTVHSRYTLSLYNSNLRDLLSAWFPAWDLNVMDASGEIELHDLIGKTCMLSITNDTDDRGRTWTNVQTAMELMEGMECPEAVNAAVWFWMDSNDGNYNADYDEFSVGVRNTIAKSPEFGIWRSGRPTNVDAAPDIMDDDIPF